MKIVLACLLFVVSTIAEPPVDSRYLPPSQGNFGTPSSTYGVPGNSASHGRQTSAIIGGRQSSFSRRPSAQYGSPASGFGAPSSQYGAPASGVGAPSSQYGAPASGRAPSSQYGTPASGLGGAPSTQYGAPGSARQPSSQYGVPSLGGARGFSGSSSPSQQYGTPGVSGKGDISGYSGAEQSRQYLPPGAGGRGGYGDDGSNGEPANYSFEYMVKDDPSGNDFGHREARQGDRAEGLYYVLLPDGRKQTVEYEADQEGYKPRISYEDTGAEYSGALGYGGQGGIGGHGGNGGPY